MSETLKAILIVAVTLAVVGIIGILVETPRRCCECHKVVIFYPVADRVGQAIGDSLNGSKTEWQHVECGRFPSDISESIVSL